MVRKTFYVDNDLVDELKKVAKEVNTSQTTIYNEFVQYGLYCYKMAKLLEIPFDKLPGIFKKGAVNYADNKRRSDNNDNDVSNPTQLFDKSDS